MSTVPAFGSRRFFVDSGAYRAVTDGRETHHSAAIAIADQLVARHWRGFTTNFVVAEAHALVLSRHGRAVAAQALHLIDTSTETTIVRASLADERRAREIIHRYADKNFSLTDAISFAVMERLRIGYAFTFNRHFAQYGFAVLTADDHA